MITYNIQDKDVSGYASCYLCCVGNGFLVVDSSNGKGNVLNFLTESWSKFNFKWSNFFSNSGKRGKVHILNTFCCYSNPELKCTNQDNLQINQIIRLVHIKMIRLGHENGIINKELNKDTAHCISWIIRQIIDRFVR